MFFSSHFFIFDKLETFSLNLPSSRLAAVYPDLFELKALLTSLTLPHHESDADPQGSEVNDTRAEVNKPGSSFTSAQLTQFMRKFHTDSTEGESKAGR